MSAYSDKVIADGAVAYWRLGETSGTVANDSIGTAHGTISGVVTLNQPGAIADGNKAMMFDGITGAIGIPAGAFLQFGTNPFTVEFWCRATLARDNQWALNFKGPTPWQATVPGFTVLCDAGPAIWAWISDGATQLQLQGSVSYGDSTWRHVGVTLSRGTTDVLVMYVNGLLQNQAPFTPSGRSFTASGPAVIGSHAVGQAGFQGSLDDIAIYHTALTPQQMAAHYAEGTGAAETARRRRRRFRAHAV